MLKAIETRYKGYRFRSRLEARWAVFFDVLGVKYEYEKEGYELGTAGRYLPDFWLPDVRFRFWGDGLWIEVKPTKPSESESQKCIALTRHTLQPVAVVIGSPDDSFAVDIEHFAKIHAGPALPNDEDIYWDSGVAFAVCDRCGHVTLQFIEGHYDDCGNCPGSYDWDHPRIVKAYTAARAARFEFGESGV